MPMVLSELNTQREKAGLSFNMPKVLITGSLGLVGSEAVKFFTDKGWEVVGIDANMRHQMLGTPSKEGATNIDIRDRAALLEIFQTNKFDAILHAAGQPSHDYSMEHPIEDFEINALCTLYLLQMTRTFCPEAPFAFISSDRVYGGNKPQNLEELPTRYHSDYPLKENLSVDQTPHSPFGAGKVAADMYVQEYGYQYGMKTACFRCGCITGRNHEGSELHGFMAYLTKCIKEGRTYNIFGYKGKQVRDQIHAYDLVNAIWCFIQNPKVSAVYNMGGGPDRSVSVLEAIKLLTEKLDKPFAYTVLEKPRHSDMPWHVHDVSKFKRDYPEWDYKYSLEDIIKDLCQ